MKRETILNTMLATLVSAIPSAKVERNVDKPQNLPTGGHIVLRDGSGDGEKLIGVDVYRWDWTAEIEVYVEDRDAAVRDAASAALQNQVEAALAADPSVGGLVDYLELAPGEIEEPEAPGAVTEKAALILARVDYTSDSALG